MKKGRQRERSELFAGRLMRERKGEGDEEVKAIREPTACKDRALTVPGTSSDESVRP